MTLQHGSGNKHREPIDIIQKILFRIMAKLDKLTADIFSK